MTIAATIQAAEIQATATYKATVFAAIIGGVGICSGVLISWFTALHLQNSARLKELRSTVYLELIDSFNEMTMGMTTVLLDPLEKWANHQNLIANFNGSLEKARFICETKTKVEITNSFSIFLEAYTNIDQLVGPIRTIREDIISKQAKHKEITSSFSEKFDNFKELKKADPQNFNLNNILNSMNNLIEESDKIEEELKNDKETLREKNITTQVEINKTIAKLNLKFLPVIHVLRKEIGAKTDVQKELLLYKPLK